MARTALTLAVAACVLAVVAAAPQPHFPDNWSADVLNMIAINQGGIKNADGSICCPPDSPECKVQTAFNAGIQYNWFSGNMSAFLAPGAGGVVTDYTAQKEYSVNASGYCQEYCPLEGQTMLPGIGMGNGTIYQGQVTYNGETVSLYTATQVFPILNITMETTDFYIKEATGKLSVPIAIIQHITPFGQNLGQQNQTFASFTSGVPAKSHFTVIGGAQCKQAKGCNGQGGDDDGGNGNSMYTLLRNLAADETVRSELDASIVREMKGAVPKISFSL